MVEVVDHQVRPLAYRHCLIDQISHLLGHPFTSDPEQTTRPGAHEIHRPRPHGVGGIVHLLSTVMSFDAGTLTPSRKVCTDTYDARTISWFTILPKNLARNVVQSKHGTITSPFSVPHSCDKFTSDDCSTTATIPWRHSTFVLRYKPKAPVTAEVGVASQQERQSDTSVSSNQHSPHQIPHHAWVLVLATAIVSMQDDIHRCHSCSRNSAALTLLCWHHLCEHSHPGES